MPSISVFCFRIYFSGREREKSVHQKFHNTYTIQLSSSADCCSTHPSETAWNLSTTCQEYILFVFNVIRFFFYIRGKTQRTFTIIKCVLLNKNIKKKKKLSTYLLFSRVNRKIITKLLSVKQK